VAIGTVQHAKQRNIVAMTVPPNQFWETFATELKFSNQPVKKSFSTLSATNCRQNFDLEW
jgi:hypothetical protein